MEITQPLASEPRAFRILVTKMNELSNDGLDCDECPSLGKCLELWDLQACDFPILDKSRSKVNYEEKMRQAYAGLTQLCERAHKV